MNRAQRFVLNVSLGMMSAFLVMGCDIINPAEEIPATIHVAPFTFQAQPGQGSAQNKITEVWVYANNSFQGAFAPPVDIPYYGDGTTRFTFRPGIRNNGIATDAIVYPMFTAYSTDLNLVSGEVVDVDPATGYAQQAVFGFLADFELGNPFTENRDTVSASKMIQSTSDVFEGQYAGEMVLSEQAYFIEVGHTIPISDLPSDGTPVYLEFRYKSEVEMSIGLLGIDLTGQSFSNFFYLVRPSADWNMLYIDLTDLISASALPGYKILFRSLYPADATEPQYHIYLDNLKVVHL